MENAADAPREDAPNPEPTVHMQSRIWREEPEADNPFAAKAAYCHGYDVYGGMLGRSGWADMIFLLFRGEAPSPSQSAALDILAVALANPGPRDPSVHAAMCGGVGGSPAAASLIAALAVGAGSLGGSREIVLAMEAWKACGRDLAAWKKLWRENRERAPEPADIWPQAEHPAGFDPHGVSTPAPVRQVLDRLSDLDPGSHAAWMRAKLPALESAAGHPVSLAGAAAAGFTDLGLDPEQGEMLFLLLRLPGAAAHALEQRGFGHKLFPFYRMELQDGPREKRP